jgi:hypothetical protein
MTLRNGCRFRVDTSACRRAMRRLLNECDSGGTDKYWGGVVHGNCADWQWDPNLA